MPLWGKTDQANNAPRNKFTVPDNVANGQVLFGNTTPGAFTNGAAVGVFGVDAAEAAALRTNDKPRGAHAGWNRVQQGTGPVTEITVSAAGTGYSNTDFVRVSGGQVNATANIVTDGAGAIQSVTVNNGGRGFKNTGSLTVAIRNAADNAASDGTDATLAPVLGGRAGRVQVETLVAMGSMTGDASDDALFPDS